MNDAKAYLQTLPFWNELTPTQQEMLEEAAFFRHFEPDAMLYNGEDSYLGMVYILSGEVRAYLLSDEGREITLYRLKQEEMCILSASSVISHINYETHMITVQETDILLIPTPVYRELMEQNIYVRCFTYELTTQRFATIMWVLQQILFARFDQRLACFLVEEFRRTDSEEICMTQEQIAQNVNSAREVVARMLRRFAAEGLIENSRGMILLKDIPSLERLGGSILQMEKFTKCSQ